jgi:N-acetylmuramoyl-L-alanine amidase
VLLGATMPAVLVEVGFLDHPIEGKELADPAVQQQLAGAIAEAISEQLAD